MMSFVMNIVKGLAVKSYAHYIVGKYGISFVAIVLFNW